MQVVLECGIAHVVAVVAQLAMRHRAFVAAPDKQAATDNVQIRVVPEVAVGVDAFFWNAEGEVLRLGERVGFDQRITIRMQQLVFGPDLTQAGVLRYEKRFVVRHDGRASEAALLPLTPAH